MPRGSTTRAVEVCTAEEDVGVPTIHLQGKYQAHGYFAQDSRKTYLPRIYKQDYKQLQGERLTTDLYLRMREQNKTNDICWVAAVAN